MSAVAAPADRRFRRAHVKPARRRLMRRLGLRAAVVAAAIVLTSVWAVSAVVHGRLLAIDRIVVRGNERLSKEEVVGLLDGLRGESLLSTDLENWRRRLLTSPWVRDVVLRRSLPATLDVTVQERLPAMIGRFDGEMFLVDDRGVAIDAYGPRYSDIDLPMVDGLGEGDDARAELAARALGALRARPDIAKRLSQMDVSDLQNVSVILSGDPAVVNLGADQFLTRLESYLELAPTLRERVPEIDYVDLRFDGRIYVRPVARVERATVSVSSSAPLAVTAASGGSKARRKR